MDLSETSKSTHHGDIINPFLLLNWALQLLNLILIVFLITLITMWAYEGIKRELRK
jgi:hypothetical protein